MHVVNANAPLILIAAVIQAKDAHAGHRIPAALKTQVASYKKKVSK